MDLLSSIVLGIVQGATEFIPVSSSGHLIVVRDLLGLELSGTLGFDAVLQLATSLAILVYFRRDFWDLLKSLKSYVMRDNRASRENSLINALILGTIPAVVLGLILEDAMDAAFRDPSLVLGTLVIGALLMWYAEIHSRRRTSLMNDQKEIVTGKQGWWIGFFQALALVPGMSRSGSTISGGLFLGLNREEATRFAFMLGLPVLLGSGIKKILDLSSTGELQMFGIELLVGSIAAFVVGLWAMDFLIKYLKTKSLLPFIIYRIGLALVLLIINL